LAARSQRLRSAEKGSRIRRVPVASLIYRALRHGSLVLDQRLDGTRAAGVLARVWTWQLWRRVAARPVVIRCAEGSLLLAPPWSRSAAAIAGVGLVERDDAIFVMDLLRPGDLFVDVGANIGFYTVLAARRGARVSAYEPAGGAAEACERSVALNGVAGGVSIHRAACGAASGVVRFTTGLDISNHIVQDGYSGVEVPVRALDAELADEDPPLTMLKVDAEGHDLDVLRGATAALERLRPVIQVEIWTGGAAPLQLLEPLGYRPYRYDPGARVLNELVVGERRGGNMLLIADATIEEVRRRVRLADRPPLRAPSVRWLP
jgi:FkbM family methyltransferase